MQPHSIPPLTEKDIARFWAKVERRGSNECWHWQAGTNKRGYGVFRIKDKYCYAHRVAYTIARGPIPDGMTIDHGCRVHGCVNPAHLTPMTGAENSTLGNLLVETCRKGHPRTPENLYYTTVRRNGRTYVTRICKPCAAEWHKKNRSNAA